MKILWDYPHMANPLLSQQLVIDRCPHCNVANPTLEKMWESQTSRFDTTDTRCWRIYRCTRCGGLVSAFARSWDQPIGGMYPNYERAHESIPQKARDFLNQAMDSLQSPAGAVMLAASAVDELLKQKGYKEGKLHPRINKAAKEHVITSEMGKWAHQVRLDANNQRHADENASLPTEDEARQSIEFATALAEFLFVLPSKVRQGLKQSAESDPKPEGEKTEE